MIALSARAVTRDMTSWPEILAGLEGLLEQRYKIEHVTLQPEIGEQTPADGFAPVFVVNAEKG